LVVRELQPLIKDAPQAHPDDRSHDDFAITPLAFSIGDGGSALISSTLAIPVIGGLMTSISFSWCPLATRSHGRSQGEGRSCQGKRLDGMIPEILDKR
jgi:hypothetical protein